MLRSNIRSIGLAFALVGGLVASATASANSLSFVSEPNDYIGLGQTLSFGEGVTATASSDSSVVSIAVNTPDHWFYVDIAAPNGQPLVPGVYTGAVRYPFQNPTQPGLAVYGDGRGCNQDFGTFTVTASKFGPYGYIEQFEATFEQHCESPDAPGLFGQVSISNPPPPQAMTFNLTASSTGTVIKQSGQATVGGTVTCSADSTAQVEVALSQRSGRKSLAYGSSYVSVPCGPTPTNWSATIVSGSSLPFAQGQAQLDVSGYAWDPNYGGQQSQSVSTVVNLGINKRAVKTQKGVTLN